ncbi:hypothetical protein A0J61_00858 [Choanephora cucurbitarum]|uniref:Chromatin modification-related protein EAF7 n=1 Tax=Choanephora cucurbitarum TaxID=101091 RepID=A0A1C7NQ53_9FUNG|nr:hypothetical protein A0J61_00858 [Choanephora cucurbitarum]
MTESVDTKELDHPVKIEESNEQSQLSHKEWDASMELALLNAISRCKPVEIWDKLGEFYGMSALDELEEEDEEQEEEEREEQERKKGDTLLEFSLPFEEYEQLISEHRQDDQSVSSVQEESSASPVLPPAKRTRTSKRDTSPTNSVADSITSTPEPEEGKSSRRASRGARKSEATPEPAGRNTPRRAAGRSVNTPTRGSKRQTNKRK